MIQMDDYLKGNIFFQKRTICFI